MVENLARILAEMGLVERAIQFIDRAIAVRGKAQGEGHPMTVNALALRGSFNLQAGRHDAAVKDFERQRALAIKAFGRSHVEVAQAEYNLAVALEGSKDLERAESGYRAALAIFEQSAPGHHFVVNAWRGLGDVATARGDTAAAARHYKRAVELAQKTGHTGLGDLLHLLAGAHAKRKEWTAAAEVLSRAVKVRRSGGGDRALLALAEFELARALWAGAIDRGRAVKLAGHARALFAAAGTRAENNVKEVDAWLRKRGGDVQR
jgi:tetratricopeptide (TPR) repeat protein